MSVLTTREWATLIWILVILVYALTHQKIRKALLNVIVILFDEKLRLLWEIILLYVLIITRIFSFLPFWSNSYIKDIIVWFLFSGLIFCMNAVSNEADERYTKKLLKDNLKFAIVVEFIISTFTFNIWIELAIIPVLTILVLMDAIAEREERYYSVHNLLHVVLGLAGLWMLYETVKIAFHEYHSLIILDTFVSFMIPIVYLILIIPLEYVLQLYAKYEVLFLRMTFKEADDKKRRRRHKFLIIKVCKFSVYRILLFQRKYLSKMYTRMSESEFEQLIAEFKKDIQSDETRSVRTDSK